MTDIRVLKCLHEWQPLGEMSLRAGAFWTCRWCGIEDPMSVCITRPPPFSATTVKKAWWRPRWTYNEAAVWERHFYGVTA